MSWGISRRRVTHVARTTVAATSWWSGLSTARSLLLGPAVRVLTYHRFRHAPSDRFSVAPDEFARQMAWIGRTRRAVSLDDVLDFVAGRRTLPDGAVLVTIDDGFADVASVALPVLESLAIPAVAFIPAGGLDEQGVGASEDGAKLTRDQVRSVARCGIEVGSHGWSHQSLGILDADSARYEIEHSRARLESVTGQRVRAFAYPYGTRLDYTEATRLELARCGYTCAFTSQHGCVLPGHDALELPRIKVEGGWDDRLFQRAMCGALDAWGTVDRFAFRFQATPATRARQTHHTGGANRPVAIFPGRSSPTAPAASKRP